MTPLLTRSKIDDRVTGEKRQEEDAEVSESTAHKRSLARQTLGQTRKHATGFDGSSVLRLGGQASSTRATTADDKTYISDDDIDSYDENKSMRRGAQSKKKAQGAPANDRSTSKQAAVDQSPDNDNSSVYLPTHTRREPTSFSPKITNRAAVLADDNSHDGIRHKLALTSDVVERHAESTSEDDTAREVSTPEKTAESFKITSSSQTSDFRSRQKPAIMAKTRNSFIADRSQALGGDSEAQRGRRMFQGLLGTLQKFRSEEQEKHKVAEEKQAVIQKKLEATLEDERNDAMMKRRQFEDDRRKKAFTAKADAVARYEKLAAYHERYATFVCSSTGPPIYYKPKILNAAHKRRLKESNTINNRYLEEQRETLDAELKRIDARIADVGADATVTLVDEQQNIAAPGQPQQLYGPPLRANLIRVIHNNNVADDDDFVAAGKFSGINDKTRNNNNNNVVDIQADEDSSIEGDASSVKQTEEKNFPVLASTVCVAQQLVRSEKSPETPVRIKDNNRTGPSPARDATPDERRVMPKRRKLSGNEAVFDAAKRPKQLQRQLHASPFEADKAALRNQPKPNNNTASPPAERRRRRTPSTSSPSSVELPIRTDTRQRQNRAARRQSDSGSSSGSVRSRSQSPVRRAARPAERRSPPRKIQRNVQPAHATAARRRRSVSSGSPASPPRQQQQKQQQRLLPARQGRGAPPAATTRKRSASPAPRKNLPPTSGGPRRPQHRLPSRSSSRSSSSRSPSMTPPRNAVGTAKLGKNVVRPVAVTGQRKQPQLPQRKRRTSRSSTSGSRRGPANSSSGQSSAGGARRRPRSPVMTRKNKVVGSGATGGVRRRSPSSGSSTSSDSSSSRHRRRRSPPPHSQRRRRS